MRELLALVTLLGAASALPNQLTSEERRAGWRLLFDGKTTRGWSPNKAASAAPIWSVKTGELTPPQGPVCWYVHEQSHLSYEVTGECWPERHFAAMLGVAETTGKPRDYVSTQVFSSTSMVEGQWTSFRLTVRAGKASLAWKGQAKPEQVTFDAKPTHFQLGYFGPGKVRFRSLKLRPLSGGR